MPQPTAFDNLLRSLEQFREARIRQRKGQIAKDFVLARSILREMYREWPPEDLPVDVNRVTRDIDIERDLTIDRECDEINDAYRVVVGVLRVVADKHPEYYQAVAKSVGADSKGWRRRSRKRIRHSAAPRGVPMKVIASISADVQQAAIGTILAGGEEGASFREVCVASWPRGPTGPQKKSLRGFLRFMRESGHIRDNGANTSSLRYSAGATLQAFAKTYGDHA